MALSWNLEGTISPEDLGFQLASLRWFLRFYQRLRPEVLFELQTRVLPVYSLWREKQVRVGEDKDLREAILSWIQDFGLPCSSAMAGEVVQTLAFPLRSGRLVFWWDFVREEVKAMKRDGAPRWTKSHPFKFEAPGWTPAEESIEEARQRLRDEFENALKAHTALWYQSQRIGADLLALRQRHRVHVRNIRWLAQKQACPALSQSSIARRHKVSEDTVRRGLHSAAECIGIEGFRRARPGRKSRPRLT